MSDNKKNRGAPDSLRIDVNDADEVAYWTKELGVSERKLKAAVVAAGTYAYKVRAYLHQERDD